MNQASMIQTNAAAASGALDTTQKQNFFHVAGSVIVNIDGALAEYKCGITFHTERDYLTAHNLNQASQALYASMLQKVAPEKQQGLQLVDLEITAISPLGRCTPAVFHEVPADVAAARAAAVKVQ